MDIGPAIVARQPLFDAEHTTAFRLFNGFSEGDPSLVLDVYGKCLVMHDYGNAPIEAALAQCKEKLPWLTAAVLKTRDGDAKARNGKLIFGTELPKTVVENGVRYAVNLTMNRDASLYLDTRGLRAWAKAALKGKRVLNTFAYTGSLSVAAKAGGAAQVITTDANRQFLDLAQESFHANQIGVQRRDFVTGDFFEVVSKLKRVKTLFDAVILDPPFFAKSDKGTVDIQEGMGALVNKVRPLVGHDGYLVLVNNAVFVSGAQFQTLIEQICHDGYVTEEARIDVPDDCRGYNRVGTLPADPAPFNHSTKIVVLRAKRKDGRTPPAK